MKALNKMSRTELSAEVRKLRRTIIKERDEWKKEVERLKAKIDEIRKQRDRHRDQATEALSKFDAAERLMTLPMNETHLKLFKAEAEIERLKALLRRERDHVEFRGPLTVRICMPAGLDAEICEALEVKK